MTAFISYPFKGSAGIKWSNTGHWRSLSKMKKSSESGGSYIFLRFLGIVKEFLVIERKPKLDRQWQVCAYGTSI